MNLPAKHPISKWIPIFLIVLMLLSCNFVTNLASNSSSNQAGGETPVVEQPSSSSEIPTTEPDPLDHLLSLRSITIKLSALRPDGSSSST